MDFNEFRFLGAFNDALFEVRVEDIWKNCEYVESHSGIKIMDLRGIFNVLPSYPVSKYFFHY